jgi:intracellular sulfur oxidation DsrE/DsrF family protein
MNLTHEQSDIVLLITRQGMGTADPELQMRLVGNYLRLLDESNLLPAIICFYAEGVKLLVEGSPVIESLQSLEHKGVRLIACSTCLNYYGLADKIRVGIIGGMTDIIEAQWHAGKVITI